MLQQFIERHVRPVLDRSRAAGTKSADTAASRWRSSDWLLGGALTTLAVVFVAGLLGLRSSTAELQDQTRNTTRDLAALKADTAERINGIAGDLAKTNQTLTDLIALRGAEGAAKGALAGAGIAGASDERAAGRPREGKPAADGSAPQPAARSVAKPVAKHVARPVAKPEAVRLGAITVRRQPERARTQAVRQSKPPVRPAASHVEARTVAEALRERRESIVRQLRLRRLAGRGNGAQPL